MNSKEHLYISMAKSSIRIFGVIIACASNSLSLLAITIVIAECLGIMEELVDKR